MLVENIIVVCIGELCDLVKFKWRDDNFFIECGGSLIWYVLEMIWYLIILINGMNKIIYCEEYMLIKFIFWNEICGIV